MKEIELTKGYKTMVDDADYEWLNQWKWKCYFNKKSNTVYAVRTDHKLHFEIRMHRLIMNANDPLIQIDHIDNDGLNNQRYNLRPCTNAQNNQNKPLTRLNKSGFRGVFKRDRSKGKYTLNRERRLFVATIYCNGVKMELGYFHTDIEAAKAYNAKAIELHGEFARLNDV